MLTPGLFHYIIGLCLSGSIRLKIKRQVKYILNISWFYHTGQRLDQGRGS